MAEIWNPPVFSRRPGAEAAWNAIVSQIAAPLPLRALGTSARIALASPPLPDDAGLLVRFAGGAGLVLVPVHFPYRTLFGVELDLADFPILPPILREAIEDGLLGFVAASVPDLELGAPAIVGRGPWSSLDLAGTGDDPRWFDVSLDGLAPEPIRLLVGCPLALLLDVFAGTPLRPAHALKGRLLREGHVTLGALRLSGPEFRALAAGSVVVLDEAAAAPDLMRIRVEEWLFVFRRADQGWTCLGQQPIGIDGTRDDGAGMGGMEQDGTHGPGAATAPRDLLDVQVDFDLGRVSVPLSEIEAWQPGSVVPLQPQLPGEGVEVTLRVNGRIVGSGDIVRIDDRIGVRISRLLFGL